MSAELITGISELTTVDPESRVIPDAAVVIERGEIVWIGPQQSAPAADLRTDVGGRAMLPGWVDSHTHLVFAGDRSAEFVARMAGEPYQAGGIGVTMSATRAASDQQLRDLIAARVRGAVQGGTTCLEVKTGYGLSVAEEERAARLAAEVTDEVTFLGAHLTPPGISTDDYVDLVCG
ncbi:MAG TPA: imidazolonepropionase, partial [Marmoricola sp.]|nr:imidazolonepropionase [Marmoricola sp.]